MWEGREESLSGINEDDVHCLSDCLPVLQMYFTESGATNLPPIPPQTSQKKRTVWSRPICSHCTLCSLCFYQHPLQKFSPQLLHPTPQPTIFTSSLFFLPPSSPPIRLLILSNSCKGWVMRNFDQKVFKLHPFLSSFFHVHSPVSLFIYDPSVLYC